MVPTMKSMISDTFLELSKVKSIDKITVKDLVETCNITRQTFYYHFQDLMDVVQWTLQQKMDAILEESLQAASMQDAIRILISTVENHFGIINRLMSSRNREHTERLLISTIRAYLQEMIDKKELGLDMKRSDMEMAVGFYSHGIVGILLEICLDRKSVDLDKISRQIHQLISGELFMQEDSEEL